MTNDQQREVPVCPTCGSANISADAAARFNPGTKTWEVSDVFDKGKLCDDCGAEFTEPEWAEIPKALRNATTRGAFMTFDSEPWDIQGTRITGKPFVRPSSPGAVPCIAATVVCEVPDEGSGSLEHYPPGMALEHKHLIRAAPRLFYVLERILAAHDSNNNGAVMGEAILCGYFAGMARSALNRAKGVQS